MECGKILLVFLFLTIFGFYLVQCEAKDVEPNKVISTQESESEEVVPILLRSQRQGRQNEEEEIDEESDLNTNGTAPLIDVPALANYLSAAVKNASLANITRRIQNVNKIIFRPFELPIKRLTDLLGLSKPKIGAGIPVGGTETELSGQNDKVKEKHNHKEFAHKQNRSAKVGSSQLYSEH